LQKPPHLTLEEWQTELRRQFGREQNYHLRNLGDQKFFSEFEVTNPETKGKYRVEIRGTRPGENRCTCPDFATNSLGTCKHVEFTSRRWSRSAAAAAAGGVPAAGERGVPALRRAAASALPPRPSVRSNSPGWRRSTSVKTDPCSPRRLRRSRFAEEAEA
jgi:hypothetical protein